MPTAVEESVEEATERSLLKLLGVVLAFLLVMGGPAAAFLLSGGDSTLGGGGGVSRVGGGDGQVERVALDLEKRFDSVPGFAEVITDVEHGRVTVRWQGKPPEELVSFAWSLPSGVVVRIEAARYSSERLFAAAAQLAQRAQEAGLALTSVGPNGNHSGLVAAVDLGEAGSFGEVSAELDSWTDIAIVVRPAERENGIYRSGALTRP